MSTWEKFHVNISIHTHRKSCNVHLPKNDYYQNCSVIMCSCITAVSLLICIIYVTCIIKMLIFLSIRATQYLQEMWYLYIRYTSPYLKKCSYTAKFAHFNDYTMCLICIIYANYIIYSFLVLNVTCEYVGEIWCQYLYPNSQKYT